MFGYSFRFLKKLFRLKIRGVIQIGAHDGQEIQGFNDAGVKNLLMIEPLPKTFVKLTDHTALYKKKFNSLLLERVALGNKTSKVIMHVDTANKGASSSVLEPKKHLELQPHIEFNEKEQVGMITLDNLMVRKALPVRHYNFLFIDVQGYELEVLKGAAKTLSEVDYIISEINGTEMYQGCALVEELDGYLDQFGFQRMVTSWTNKREKIAVMLCMLRTPLFGNNIYPSIFLGCYRAGAID